MPACKPKHPVLHHIRNSSFRNIRELKEIYRCPLGWHMPGPPIYFLLQGARQQGCVGSSRDLALVGVAWDSLRGTSLYVVMLGGYRVFYALNWIYKKVPGSTFGVRCVRVPVQRCTCQINMPRYSDIQSWIGGLVEIMFFLDFLNYRSWTWQFLRQPYHPSPVDILFSEVYREQHFAFLCSQSRHEDQ